MVEQILEDLWRIEVPLPNTPLRAVNSYVIRGASRNLIVDTGLNLEECRKAMCGGLEEIGIDLGRTDFFITHMHADHSALVPALAAESSKVYFNGPDAQVLREPFHWEPMLEYAAAHGFPEDELRAAMHSHPGYRHGATKVPALTLLEDGSALEAGDHRFRCIQTPGHTRGHMCLYEPARKLLLSGDHLLVDITPNIQCWSDKLDPLAEYLASLEKVAALEVDLVLPGHRRLFRDHRGRIEELKAHHRRRAGEVLSILDEGPKNAFQVASQMTWDIDCDSWDGFPVAQKWFATGETIAHLRYLEAKGRILRENSGEGVAFRRTSQAR
ncbi:MAG: MBL fold metallo-hydrolase [bacterium]